MRLHSLLPGQGTTLCRSSPEAAATRREHTLASGSRSIPRSGMKSAGAGRSKLTKSVLRGHVTSIQYCFQTNTLRQIQRDDRVFLLLHLLPPRRSSGGGGERGAAPRRLLGDRGERCGAHLPPAREPAQLLAQEVVPGGGRPKAGGGSPQIVVLGTAYRFPILRMCAGTTWPDGRSAVTPAPSPARPPLPRAPLPTSPM